MKCSSKDCESEEIVFKFMFNNHVEGYCKRDLDIPRHLFKILMTPFEYGKSSREIEAITEEKYLLYKKLYNKTKTQS